MSPKHNAADKVRPILEAMERSIDAARSTRLQPVRVATAPPLPAPLIAPAVPGSNGDGRLKARPKRSWM